MGENRQEDKGTNGIQGRKNEETNELIFLT
jgi:hypothetical protein